MVIGAKEPRKEDQEEFALKEVQQRLKISDRDFSRSSVDL